MPNKRSDGKKVYCVHPGEVRSKNDREMHFIDAPTLISLYHVNPKQCKIFRSPKDHVWSYGLLCLYPRYDGKYDVRVVEKELYA